MGKKISAVLIGTIAAVVIILLVQMIVNSLYPLPTGIKQDDIEKIRAIYLNMPLAAYLLLLLAYILGSFVGGLTAALISHSGKQYLAMIIGIILLLMAVVNLFKYPHPVWFTVASLLAFLPFAYLGAKVRK